MPTLAATHSTEVDANADLVRRFMDTVWNAANADAIDDFLSPDYLDHTYQPPTAAGHKAMVNVFNAAFGKARHHITQLTAQADRVVIQLRITAQHTGPFRGIAATGQPIDVTQYRSFRLAHGRIVEHHALFDTATLLRQIGGSLDAAQACKPR